MSERPLKFVHAADLHIDSPLSGLLRYEGAPVEQIRGATRRAMENLVSLCVDEQVQLLLLAGDLFDGDWKDYSTGLFFASQMQRLRREGIRVVMVRGNHDAASQITKHLRLPDNVLELPSKRPATHQFEDLGVAVHGQSYPRRAVTDDLALNYPDRVEGCINVGLLHTCASGRPGHEPYAPCKLQTLKSKGYDYWALGHVHQPEVLAEDPYIVFSGNLQGRHIQELGPKGATLVTVEHGRIQGVEHCPLDVVRWLTCIVDASRYSDAADVVDEVASALDQVMAENPGLTLAIRVIVEGATAAHKVFQHDPERWESEIRVRAVEREQIWIEGVRFSTRPLLDRSTLLGRNDALGQLIRSLSALRDDPTRQATLLSLFDDLRTKLPADIRAGSDGIRLEQPSELLDALVDVEQLLTTELLNLSEGD